MQKMKLNIQAIFEKFYVENLSNLNGQDNFLGKTQEPDFSHT